MGVYGASFLFFSSLFLCFCDLRISGPSQRRRDQVDGGAILRRFFKVIFRIGFILLVLMAKGQICRLGARAEQAATGRLT